MNRMDIPKARMLARFIIESLDIAKHRRQEFDGGVEALNHFLQRQARKEMEANMSACFVAVPEADEGRIAGFFTLCAVTIARIDLPEPVSKKLPRYSSLPATLLGRLATSLEFRGQGVGSRLMHDAFHRTILSADQVASWGLVTNPKDSAAHAFYAKFGFVNLNEQRMFIPLNTMASRFRG